MDTNLDKLGKIFGEAEVAPPTEHKPNVGPYPPEAQQTVPPKQTTMPAPPTPPPTKPFYPPYQSAVDLTNELNQHSTAYQMHTSAAQNEWDLIEADRDKMLSLRIDSTVKQIRLQSYDTISLMNLQYLTPTPLTTNPELESIIREQDIVKMHSAEAKARFAAAITGRGREDVILKASRLILSHLGEADFSLDNFLSTLPDEYKSDKSITDYITSVKTRANELYENRKAGYTSTPVPEHPRTVQSYTTKGIYEAFDVSPRKFEGAPHGLSMFDLAEMTGLSVEQYLAADTKLLAETIRSESETRRKLIGVMNSYEVPPLDFWESVKLILWQPMAFMCDIGEMYSSIYGRSATGWPKMLQAVMATETQKYLSPESQRGLQAGVESQRAATYGYGDSGIRGKPSILFIIDPEVAKIGQKIENALEGKHSWNWIETAWGLSASMYSETAEGLWGPKNIQWAAHLANEMIWDPVNWFGMFMWPEKVVVAGGAIIKAGRFVSVIPHLQDLPRAIRWLPWLNNAWIRLTDTAMLCTLETFKVAGTAVWGESVRLLATSMAHESAQIMYAILRNHFIKESEPLKWDVAEVKKLFTDNALELFANPELASTSEMKKLIKTMLIPRHISAKEIDALSVGASKASTGKLVKINEIYGQTKMPQEVGATASLNDSTQRILQVLDTPATAENAAVIKEFLQSRMSTDINRVTNIWKSNDARTITDIMKRMTTHIVNTHMQNAVSDIGRYLAQEAPMQWVFRKIGLSEASILGRAADFINNQVTIPIARQTLWFTFFGPGNAVECLMRSGFAGYNVLGDMFWRGNDSIKLFEWACGANKGFPVSEFGLLGSYEVLQSLSNTGIPIFKDWSYGRAAIDKVASKISFWGKDVGVVPEWLSKSKFWNPYWGNPTYLASARSWRMQWDTICARAKASQYLQQYMRSLDYLDPVGALMRSDIKRSLHNLHLPGFTKRELAEFADSAVIAQTLGVDGWNALANKNLSMMRKVAIGFRTQQVLSHHPYISRLAGDRVMYRMVQGDGMKNVSGVVRELTHNVFGDEIGYTLKTQDLFKELTDVFTAPPPPCFDSDISKIILTETGTFGGPKPLDPAIGNTLIENLKASRNAIPPNLHSLNFETGPANGMYAAKWIYERFDSQGKLIPGTGHITVSRFPPNAPDYKWDRYGHVAVGSGVTDPTGMKFAHNSIWHEIGHAWNESLFQTAPDDLRKFMTELKDVMQADSQFRFEDKVPWTSSIVRSPEGRLPLLWHNNMRDFAHSNPAVAECWAELYSRTFGLREPGMEATGHLANQGTLSTFINRHPELQTKMEEVFGETFRPSSRGLLFTNPEQIQKGCMTLFGLTEAHTDQMHKLFDLFWMTGNKIDNVVSKNDFLRLAHKEMDAYQKTILDSLDKFVSTMERDSAGAVLTASQRANLDKSVQYYKEFNNLFRTFKQTMLDVFSANPAGKNGVLNWAKIRKELYDEFTMMDRQRSRYKAHFHLDAGKTDIPQLQRAIGTPTTADVAQILGKGTPEDLIKSLYLGESGTLTMKDRWVHDTAALADGIAQKQGLDHAWFLGYGERDLAPVYDNMMRSMNLDPQYANSMSLKLRDVNEIKQNLEHISTGLSVEQGTVDTWNKWVSDWGQKIEEHSRDYPLKLLVAPLALMGTKRALFPDLARQIGHVDGRIIDPFFGGGVIPLTLNKMGVITGRGGTKVLAQEADPRLVGIWSVIKEHPEAIVTQIKKLYLDGGGHIDKQQAEVLKAIFNKDVDNTSMTSIERAAYYEVLSHHSVMNNLAINDKGHITGGMKDITDKFTGTLSNERVNRLFNASVSLRGVELKQATHTSYLDHINNALPGDLLFLDPPYTGRSLTYSGERIVGKWTDKDRDAMLKAAKSAADRGVRVVITESVEAMDVLAKAGFNVRKVRVSRSGGGKSLGHEECLASNETLLTGSPDQLVRDMAQEEARKGQYLTYPDYTRDNAGDDFMRKIFPYWTYEGNRPAWLAKTFVQKPGIAHATSNFFEENKDGYTDIPGTDYQWNWGANSVWSTLRRNKMKDNEEYYKGLAPLDQFFGKLGRMGFYPGAWYPVVSKAAGVGDSEFGSILPPFASNAINIARGLFPDNPIISAIQEVILPSSWRNYLNMKWMVANGFDAKTILDKKLGRSQVPLTKAEETIWNQASQFSSLYSFVNTEIGGNLRYNPEVIRKSQLAEKLMIEKLFNCPVKLQDWINERSAITGKDLSHYIPIDPISQGLIHAASGINRVGGMGYAIMPPAAQSAYHNEMSYQDNMRRIHEKYYSGPDGKQEIEKQVLDWFKSGGTGDVGLSPSQWRSSLKDIQDHQAVEYEALNNMPEYIKVPKTTDEKMIAIRDSGSQHLTDALTMMADDYYNVKLDMIDDPDVPGKQVPDYNKFWAQRQSIIDSLDPKDKAMFMPLMRKYDTNMEKILHYVSENYFRPYDAVYDMILQDYSPDERNVIKKYWSASPDVRKAMDKEYAVVKPDTEKIANLRKVIPSLPNPQARAQAQLSLDAEVAANTRSIISEFSSRVSDAHKNMRMAYPDLDAWLMIFGRVSTAAELKATVTDKKKYDAYNQLSERQKAKLKDSGYTPQKPNEYTDEQAMKIYHQIMEDISNGNYAPYQETL